MICKITNDIFSIEFFVDDDDEFLLEVPWYASIQDGNLRAIYRNVQKNGKREAVYLHRVIMKLTTQNKCVVDHIDGNPANNRKSNLRVCTQADNLGNQSKPKNNTSGYKGVSFEKNNKKWRVYISRHRKRVHLGYFDTPEEAYLAYCNAAKQAFGQFAKTE